VAVGEDDPCVSIAGVPGDEGGEARDRLLVLAGPGEGKALPVQDPPAPWRLLPGGLKALDCGMVLVEPAEGDPLVHPCGGIAGVDLDRPVQRLDCFRVILQLDLCLAGVHPGPDIAGAKVGCPGAAFELLLEPPEHPEGLALAVPCLRRSRISLEGLVAAGDLLCKPAQFPEGICFEEEGFDRAGLLCQHQVTASDLLVIFSHLAKRKRLAKQGRGIVRTLLQGLVKPEECLLLQVLPGEAGAFGNKGGLAPIPDEVVIFPGARAMRLLQRAGGVIHDMSIRNKGDK